MTPDIFQCSLPGQPKEGLLKVVVGLGRDVVVLEVLLAVEHDGLGLDLAVLDVDLVAAQHDGDVLADAHEVPVPVGHVLVGHPGSHVEHDDGALALKRNIVSLMLGSEKNGAAERNQAGALFVAVQRWASDRALYFVTIFYDIPPAGWLVL